MTALGAFRDDFYNAVNVLINGQFNSTSQASGVLAASVLAGATENYVSSSGATALTLDSTVNIIAQLQQAVATAYKAAINAAGAGVNPPSGVPNLFNVAFYVAIRNTNAGTLTLTLGAGQTLGNGVLTIATGVERQYLFTVTSPTTILINDLGGSTVT